MIKTILFDLDGVLWNSREMHFDVLNKALSTLSPKHVISYADHEKKFNGLTTRTKLNVLSSERGLDQSLHEKIYNLKQSMTADWLKDNVKIDWTLQLLMTDLKRAYNVGHSSMLLGVISNSIRNTTDAFLQASGISSLIDIVVTNEDTNFPKPNPAPYLFAMASLGVKPDETLIVEDSRIGTMSALATGAHVMHVNSPAETTVENIVKCIALHGSRERSNKLLVPNLNVVVPMAGEGRRFREAGYEVPKPFIEVNTSTGSRPMIGVVVDSLGIDVKKKIMLVSDASYDTHANIMRSCINGFQVCRVRTLTEGAACTVLLAKDLINNDESLLIVNSDQDVEWSYVEFMQHVNSKCADAGILTFQANDSKWSFAKLDAEGYVERVAEKDPISTHATCGIYWWRRGRNFVKHAESMITKGIRVNGEFYVCPVFNEAIAAGLKVVTHEVESMWGLGTPEDVRRYNAR